MKNKLTQAMMAVVAVVGLLSPFAVAPTTSAIDVFKGACGGNTSQVCGATTTDTVPNLAKNIIDTLFLVIGTIAVIMIIIGGIRYTVSNGDSSTVKAAKDTVLYAVVGLVVAILAYPIVGFVLEQFK